MTGVNDAAVTILPGTQTAVVNVATAISGISLTDIDHGAVDTVTLTATLGTLAATVVTGGTLTGSGTKILKVSGSPAIVSQILASLKYTSTLAGADTIQVVTTDGTATTTQSLAVTVSATANRAPVIAAGGVVTGSITERVGLVGSALADTATGTVRFTDADLTDLHTATIASVSATGVTSGLPATATLLTFLKTGAVAEQSGATPGSIPWTFSAADSTFDYLAAGAIATLTYGLVINDGHGGTVTQNVTLNITGTNDVPIIATAGTTTTGAITERVGLSGSTLIDTASGTIAFTDADRTGIHTVKVLSVASGGVVNGLPAATVLLPLLTTGAVTEPTATTAGSVGWTFSAADSTFDYLGAGEKATLTYAVQITDASGATATQNVVMTITGTNDVPVAIAHPGITTDNWTPVTISKATLLAGATDPDKTDVLTVSSVQAATNGTVAFDVSGNAVFNPIATYTGSSSFTYTITDGQGGTSTASVGLNISLHQIIGTALADVIVGTSRSAFLSGLGSNDGLVAGSAGDTLSGGTGNDALIGGAGSDTYLFTAGDGRDTVSNQDASLATTDTLLFGGATTQNQVWFGRTGNDLLVSLLGTTDSVKFANWYIDPAAQIDAVKLSNGKALTVAGINQLVSAMAAFTSTTGLAGSTITATALPSAVQVAESTAWK